LRECDAIKQNRYESGLAKLRRERRGVMDQITLAEAARTVLLTIAPLIAGGALAKIGEDITATAQETLARAWQTVEARFKRGLSAREKADLVQAATVVEARLSSQPKAARALDFYRTDPEDADAQRIIETQLVEVFKPAPEALIALAKAIAAMQPAPATAADARTVIVRDQGKVGSILQGDITGNVSLGPVDFSQNKRIASPGTDPAPVTDHSSLVTRHSSLPATLSADGVHFNYGHALIVGVADYADQRLKVAGGTTANDARALAALLRDPQLAAYPRKQVRILVDAKATRANVLDELEALAHRAAGGTALIFFAGHGEPVGDSYGLLPHDADLANLAATSLTAELFHQRIAKIRERAKRLVVVLNCCHAGGVGDEVLSATGGGPTGAAPPPAFYRPLAAGSGQVVISSARPTQKSGARSQASPQHTTFGAHLLDALRGQAPGQGAGVGVFELFAYLRARVPADAQHIRYQGKPLEQEPLFYASQLDDNIAVALRPGWQGGTLGADLEQQVRRLAVLELQLELAGETASLLAERDALLAQITSAG